MTNIKTCPDCGTELPTDAPEGLCPKCIIKQGLSIDTDENNNLDETMQSPVRNIVAEETEGRYTNIKELGKEE